MVVIKTNFTIEIVSDREKRKKTVWATWEPLQYQAKFYFLN